MKVIFSLKNIIIPIIFILGIIYYLLIQIEINAINNHSFSIYSPIIQTVKIHANMGENQIRNISCNNSIVNFNKHDFKWFESHTEEAKLHIQNGLNNCNITVYGDYIEENSKPILKNKITYIDYIVLFVLIGIPILNLIFYTLLCILKKIKSVLISDAKVYNKNKSNPIYIIPITILLLGAVIRVLYIYKFGVVTFQHDWHSHIELFTYISEHWSPPLPSKGLEFPQQPLYYIITAAIHNTLLHYSYSQEDILFSIGLFALVCSFIFLYYSYRFATLLTNNHWVLVVSSIFVALTPSIVYPAAMINNDVLVMALSSFSLYYITKSYHSGFTNNFITALAGVSLLFLTKLSATPIEIMFIILLLIVFFKTDTKYIKTIQSNMYIFYIVGIFLIGFTLLKSYMPIEDTLHMVNSTGSYPGQEIKNIGLDYFASFHIKDLINVGYSYVFGNDAIRHSFLTYLYGTMHFGESNYSEFFSVESSSIHIMIMRAIISLGLIYILGLLIFLYNLRHMQVIYKVFIFILSLNLLLIAKFTIDYPSVCNTDFRYFASAFPILGLIFAIGLEYMRKYSVLRIIFNICIFLLFISNILFFILLGLVE